MRQNFYIQFRSGNKCFLKRNFNILGRKLCTGFGNQFIYNLLKFQSVWAVRNIYLNVLDV